MTRASIIADIGSGTGFLTELFLENGNPVLGIEPNLEMRTAAESLLRKYPAFQSVPTTAESTTLSARSVDFITAGQSFHWFQPEATRREFIRILRPGGWVVLIWNDRKTTASPFLQAYENLLLRYGTDYQSVNHKRLDAEMIGSFFGAGGFRQASFPNAQVFDLEGLKGRLLSSSYSPESGHPNHIPMLEELTSIFNRHQSDGKVMLDGDTAVFYGHLSS
ncbi:MAG: Methyltransferase [Pedosphaera sp.]|nr:Methyltransferase [Pedosphaera sp.]